MESARPQNPRAINVGDAGFISQLLTASTTTKLVVAGVTLSVVFVSALLSYWYPTDAAEPPLLESWTSILGIKPTKVPLAVETIVSEGARRKWAIVTTRIMKMKTYTILDILSANTALKTKSLDTISFLKKVGFIEPGLDERLRKINRETDVIEHVTDATRASFTKQQLNGMNVRGLAPVSEYLDKLKGTNIVIDKWYQYARELVTVATCAALFGEDNPFVQGSSLVDDIWLFESGRGFLMSVPNPEKNAPIPFQARKRIQQALGAYYAKGGDSKPTAAQVTHDRARAYRNHGMTDEDVGVQEIVLIRVSVSNSAPILFWLMGYIVTRPSLVAALREETSSILQTSDDGTVTMDVSRLPTEAPLLESCFRETMRLQNDARLYRLVDTDTPITGANGKTYLLKQGHMAHTVAGEYHKNSKIWGEDACEFNPDHFLPEKAETLSAEQNRARKTAFMPFGLGRHSCPGREFAHCETLGVVAALLLTFEIAPPDGDWESWKLPESEYKTNAVRGPVGDGEALRMRLDRRAGWENTRWNFTSGGE